MSFCGISFIYEEKVSDTSLSRYMRGYTKVHIVCEPPKVFDIDPLRD